MLRNFMINERFTHCVFLLIILVQSLLTSSCSEEIPNRQGAEPVRQCMATFWEPRHPQPKKKIQRYPQKNMVWKTLTFYWEWTLYIINEKLAIALQRILIQRSIFEGQTRISSSILRSFSLCFDFISLISMLEKIRTAKR